jgi:hypothetical protein
MRLILILLPALLAAQTATMMHISATRASVKIKGVSGTCTGTLTNVDASETHPYVSAVDLSTLADYVTWADGSRIVTLGRETGDDPLRAETNYSLAISGCMTATVKFRTPPPYFGAQPARPAPWDSSRFGNLGWPTIDWTRAGRNKVYTDPLTGIQMRVMIPTGDWSSVYPDGNAGVAFPYYTGGTGWTDPQKVGNGSTTNVGKVSTTDPIDLYLDLGAHPWNWNVSRVAPIPENLGLQVYGSGTDGTQANRDFKAGLYDGTSYLVHQTIPLGSGVSGTGTWVQSASTDAGKPWPSDFYDAGYGGWTVNSLPTKAHLPVQNLTATVTVTGGSTVTLDGTLAYNHRIPFATKAGSKIRIVGSSCTNAICTVASLVNYKTLTIVETITNQTYTGYAIYPIWLRVEKTTATGEISLGLKFKSQTTQFMAPNAGRAGIECGPWTVNDGTRDGELCLVSSHSGPNGPIYFMPHDFSAPRMLSGNAINLTGQFTGWTASDVPNSDRMRAKYYPDRDTPGVWYTLWNNNGGSRSIYKIQFDMTKLADEWLGGYALNNNDGVTTATANAAGTDNVTITNMMKPSGGVECGRTAGTGCDLASQMASVSPADPEWAGANWNAIPTELVAITGPYAFVSNRSGNNGQDAAAYLFSVIRLSDGRVVNAFSSGKGVTVSGYNARLRWGSAHSAFPGIFDSAIWISQNDLGHKAGGGLFGGPFLTTPSHIKMGDGSWVAVGVDRDGAGPQTATGTRMDWPTTDPANTYDRACPTDIADWLKDYGATGNQCATFRIPDEPACTSCTNPAMSMALEVGDKLGRAGNYDSEKLRIVKITSLGGTEKEIIVSRNATFDGGCLNDDPASPRSTYCNLGSDAHSTWPDGFTFRTESGNTNGSNDTTTSMIFAEDGSGTITYIGEASQSSSGHIAYGSWPGGLKLFSGLGNSRILNNMAEFDTKYPLGDGVIKSAFPSFASGGATIGDGKVQAYLNRNHKIASADDLRWTVDHNALNPSDGSGTNIGTRTITAATGTDVWKVQVLGHTIDYKRKALLGWSGMSVLKDVSPADIASAANYSLCYVYRAGDCGQGSVGETFVKVPLVNNTITTCDTANYYTQVPCVYTGGPSSGWTRRYDTATSDVTGRWNQDLTMAFAAPGLQPGYSGVNVGASGKFFGTTAGLPIGGMRSSVFVGRMPSFTPNTVRNDYGGLTVKIGARTGMTHARVRFGNNSSFYCTERSEACLTDGALTPFAYSGDTLTNVSCSSGCSITVPAIPGRLTYYRIETYDGSTWTNGDTLTAVP